MEEQMKRLKLSVPIFIASLMIVTLFSYACTAQEPSSAQPIVLTYASPLPEFVVHAQTDLAWMDKIEKDTNGRVQFKHYLAGSLITDAEGYEELSKGVCDVAWVSRPSSPEPCPLLIATMGYFLTEPDLDIIYNIYSHLWEKYPEIRAEYDKVKVLGISVTSPGQVMTKSKPIRRVEDFQGLTLDSTSLILDVINLLGGQGVSIPPPEKIPSLEKGIVDGAIMPYETLKGFGFAEVVKYATTVNIATGIDVSRAFNWDSWNSLPADIQTVFEDNWDFFYEYNRESFLKADAEAVEYAKGLGVEFIELPPEELAKLHELERELQDQEAARVDAMGLPGTEILEEVRHLLDEYHKNK
jgi:TRAP-type C4-dicarboxylate transport system substrate-binding protein